MQPLVDRSASFSNAARATVARSMPQPKPASALLDGDRIAFDAWLLAPIQLGSSERLVQRVSQLAGPAVLLAAVAGGCAAVF
jgi:hypothetical protein